VSKHAESRSTLCSKSFDISAKPVKATACKTLRHASERTSFHKYVVDVGHFRVEGAEVDHVNIKVVIAVVSLATSKVRGWLSA
jgi:hypothetical protein